MDADTLTVLVGGAGILFSLLFSMVFYRAGKRASSEEKAGLAAEIQDLRGVLSNVFQEMDERLPSKGELRRANGLASEERSGGHDRSRAEGSSPAIEVLVRASLGALVNERGEVALPRLMREVGEAAGAPRFSEVVEVLGRLRSEGVVEWDGADASDLAGVQVLRLRPGRIQAASGERAVAEDGGAGYRRCGYSHIQISTSWRELLRSVIRG